MKYLLLIPLMINSIMGAITWQSGDWAFACDFKDRDLANAQILGEDCSGRCASTSGCTHFVWTTWNGGTCWMKSGSVTKSNAYSTEDSTMVCGIVSTGVPSNYLYGKRIKIIN